MKICVFGAGAIGGYLAVELSLAGHDVCVVARGEHLTAIKAKGLTLEIAGATKVANVRAREMADSFGPQDYIFCALKSHQAHSAARSFLPLLGPTTAVVTAMNGIPWWYFYKEGSSLEGKILQSVDPDGIQWKLIGPERAIGCVVDPACEVVAPGVIRHNQFNRFILGEPSGEVSPRVSALSNVMTQANFDAPVRNNIRHALWLKLWGNVCFNPISALTSATLDRITGEPHLRQLCISSMKEAKAVSDALHVSIDEAMMDRRLAAAGRAVGHKMSMLQDLERSRSMEIDALVTAVQELGKLTRIPTPTIDVLLTLVRERAFNAGLYDEYVWQSDVRPADAF
ncbi:MAG: 2-dehydropantoate 2-reductase [Afipia sp.]|nr:2-dehydropantoate 2-reductase [Afipia sp.]